MQPGPPLIVIFGAAVRPDGQPSPALSRRIAYGLEAARTWTDAPILCSGRGVAGGATEAAVMAAALLARGVAADRLILDEFSGDTLQNVAAAARCARAGGHAEVIACSEGYHLPRIRLLLRLLGVASRPGPAPRGPAGAHPGAWAFMSLREGLAIPHSVARLAFRKPLRAS